MIGGENVPVSGLPVFGSSTDTLKSITTVFPLPASIELGAPAEITTSPPSGKAPEGTLTVQVPPLDDPVTVPPELSIVSATTMDEKPADDAAVGGPEGA